MPNVKGLAGPFGCLTWRAPASPGAPSARPSSAGTRPPIRARSQAVRPSARRQSAVQKKLADMQTEITLGLYAAYRLGRLMEAGRAVRRCRCSSATIAARRRDRAPRPRYAWRQWHLRRNSDARVVQSRTVNTYEGTHDIHALIRPRPDRHPGVFLKTSPSSFRRVHEPRADIHSHQIRRCPRRASHKLRWPRKSGAPADQVRLPGRNNDQWTSPWRAARRCRDRRRPHGRDRRGCGHYLPALLAAGLPPVMATAANTVAPRSVRPPSMIVAVAAVRPLVRRGSACPIVGADRRRAAGADPGTGVLALVPPAVYSPPCCSPMPGGSARGLPPAPPPATRAASPIPGGGAAGLGLWRLFRRRRRGAHARRAFGRNRRTNARQRHQEL